MTAHSVTIFIDSPDVASRVDEWRIPALEKLLGRSTREHNVRARVSVRAILDLLELSLPDERDVPVAALELLALDKVAGEKWCARIDPVHVTPNRDHLLLLDNATLDIEHYEVQSFIHDLNDYFKEDGLRFGSLETKQWYCLSDKPLQVKTVPIEQAFGRDVKTMLPTGPDNRKLLSIANEIQMWLHNHEINEKRIQRGLAPVNSVWFWGTGDLASIVSRRKVSALIYARDSRLLKGMGKISDSRYVETLNELFDILHGENDIFDQTIIKLVPRDFAESRLVDAIVSIIGKMLYKGHINSLGISVGQKHFVCTPGGAKRFWKRAVNLRTVI